MSASRNYLPFNPIKGQAFRLFLPTNNNANTIYPVLSSQSKVSKDGLLFVETTNLPTQTQNVDTTILKNQGYIDLTADEMNADVILFVLNAGIPISICIYTNPSVAGGSPFATPPVQPSTGQDISTTVMTFIVSAGEQGYFISNQAKGENGFNYYGLENTATKWYIIIKEPVGSGNIGYIMRRENRSPFAVSFANRASLNYRTQPPVL